MVLLVPAQYYLHDTAMSPCCRLRSRQKVINMYTTHLSEGAFSQVHNHIKLLPNRVVGPDHPVRQSQVVSVGISAQAATDSHETSRRG